MQVYGVCKRCQGQMAILDVLMEGYDLICARCGLRELINRTIFLKRRPATNNDCTANGENRQ